MTPDTSVNLADFFLVLDGRITKLLLIEPSGTPNTGDAATAAARVEI